MTFIEILYSIFNLKFWYWLYQKTWTHNNNSSNRVNIPEAPVPELVLDPTFAKRLFNKIGREYITYKRVDTFGNAISLGSVMQLLLSFMDFIDAKFIEWMTPFYDPLFYYSVE